MERRKFITNTLAGAGAFLLPCNIFPLPAENDFEMIKPVGGPLVFIDYWSVEFEKNTPTQNYWHHSYPGVKARLTVHLLKSRVSKIEPLFDKNATINIELKRPGISTYYSGEFTLLCIDNSGICKDFSTLTFRSTGGGLKMCWDG